MRDEDKLKRNLAQESARYDVTEGAYGPGLQENITQLEGLKAQDPAQAAAYDQAIAELTRRQGLTAPDYSVASGAQNFGTRQEARQAAAPMRTEGLSGVYRQAGMIDKADELENRAFDQQRAIAREARDVEAFGLTKTKAQLDIDAGNLTLAEKQRAAAAAKNMDNFNIAFGEASAAAQAEGRTLTPRDIAGLAKANKLNFTQENELIASQVNRSEAEVKQFRLDVEKTIQGKGFEGLIDTHKNDKRFGDGVHFVPEIDSKTGGVILARVNEATGKVEERLPFKTKAEATAYLREEAVNPANAAVWLQSYRKGEAAIDRDKAAADKDRSLGNRYDRDGNTEKGLTRKVADVESLLGRKLSEPEKLTLFGLSAKPSDRPALSASDVTARAKALFEARTPSLSNPKKPMTMTEAISFVEGGMRNPIAERLDAALGGGGGDPFAPPAAPTRPPSAAQATAPRQTGSAGIDTSRPRTDVNPVTNLPREAPVSAPNLVNAATRGLDAGQARYVAYLEAKIAARERLTPDEAARAKRFGLVP
jgi:hypothetical protein